MEMTKKDERELFLRYLVDMYSQNPDLPLFYKTIYVELSRFYTSNARQERIELDSLVGVQVKLKNKLSNVDGINFYMSKDGNFFVVENRNEKNDSDYLYDMYNGVKLYIAVDKDDIYKLSEMLINFTVQNNIVMQTKIAKEMRNDVFVCRVSSTDDAVKICDYLNGLGYSSTVKPNPFLFDKGNVSFAIDSTLSYNVTLSKLLREYIWAIRNNKTIDSIAKNSEFSLNDDFNKFVQNQIEFLKSSQKNAFMDLYEIDSDTKYKDFVMVSELISNRLCDSLSIDQLFILHDNKNNKLVDTENILFEHDEDKIKYVMSILSNYYSLDYVHKLIMEFINAGDYNLFTRDYGGLRNVIRSVLENSFSKDDVKNIISNLGWDALIMASKVTYEKYGEEQFFAAIKNVFNDDDMNVFTNDYDVRSYLTFIIPPELLKKVIVYKLEEKNMSISSISLAELVMEEISKMEDMEEKKERGI